jgi:hypothetical protein
MDWFYSSVTEASGDGAAVICCGNPKETSEYFIQWWKRRHLPQMKKNGYKKDEFWHPLILDLGMLVLLSSRIVRLLMGHLHAWELINEF